MRHPLDAEIAFSEMLGSWWGEHLPGVDVERLLGEGLIAHATASDRPAGLGILAAVTALGTNDTQRTLAEQGVMALRERGLTVPRWATQLGWVTPLSAHVNGDRFGDIDEVVLVFGRESEPSGGSPEAEHALILVQDHNGGGVLRDAWITTKVETLLEQCRERARADDFARFEDLDPAPARAVLERALRRTEQVVSGADRSEAPVPQAVGLTASDLTGGSLATHFALANSRVRRLPEPSRTHLARSGLAARPARHAGREVPVLRRGGRAVRLLRCEPLHRPHHHPRVRHRQRASPPGEPAQGRVLPAALAARTGGAAARGTGGHAARTGRVGAVGRIARRAAGGRGRCDPRRGVGVHRRFRPHLPGPGPAVGSAPGGGAPTAARRRLRGTGPAHVRVPAHGQ